MVAFKNRKLLFLILLLAALLPYLYISIYVNPAADDFDYAAPGKRLARIPFLIDMYLHWNGRYTSNLLVLINPLAFNSFALYKLVPVILILLTVWSFLFFLKAIIGEYLSAIDRFIVAVFLTLLYLYQMPIISDGIYWYSGSVTYQLGNIGAITYISLLILFCNEQFVFRSKKFHLLLLTISLFITIGLNEIIMIMLSCLAFILVFIAYKNKLKHKALFNYLLVVTCICASIMFFAPGNAQRASLEVKESGIVNHSNIVHSFAFSIAQSIRFFLKWILSPPLILASVVFFYFNRSELKKHSLFSSSFYLSPLYSSLLLFIIGFIAAFPSYWMFGILGQHRTMNVAYYVFIILWFVNLTVWFNNYESKLKNIPELNISVSYLLVFILLACLFITKNGYNVVDDISSGKAKAFDEQMKERYALVQSAKDTIRFTPIMNPPKTIFTYDITKDPNHWLNTCYTDYFRCENKVVLRK